MRPNPITSVPIVSALRPALSPARWAWLATLIAGIVLAVVAVSGGLLIQTVCTVLSGALPVLAIIVGLSRHRPVRRGPWLFLCGGLALYWIAAAPGLAGLWDRNDAVVQIVTVLGYTALLVGVVGILSDGGADGDVSTLLEALILAIAAALVVWFVVIAPMRAANNNVLVGDVLGALAYPALDLAMFALAARTLLRYRRISPALLLLMPALVATAATDGAGLLTFASTTTSPAWLALGGSLIGNAFVAAAALHPSLSRPLLGDPRPIGQFLRVRVALVGAATFIGPAMLLFFDSQAQKTGIRIETPEVSLAALLVSALVVADLYLLLIRLDSSLTTRLVLESELERQANSDSLTDLPNRAAFVTRLGDLLKRDRKAVALLFCDLDDFKTVNDTLGHGAGDELLVEVGHRLRRAIRPADLAARLGGDEFAVLLGGLTGRNAADQVAARILDAFRAPFIVSDQQFTVRISIGIAFGADALGASDLMRDADIAMYLAKGRGKGRFERFRPSDEPAGASPLAMRTSLERAIVEHELTLAYQPLHELSRRSIVGVEALSRWEHPDLGPIDPLEFIRLAEQSGLIVPLGRLVLHAACRQMRAWLDAGAPPGMDLFVNVSAIQFAHRDFATELAEILKATRLPPKNLVVEVTESALVDAPDAVASFAAIKALGVRIAIDDFGTGYSSISYLARFPVDILKIDRSFVSGLNASHTSESLVRVILALGASLSLDTVAEGIETEQQLESLTRMGCTLGQGYLLSRPTSPDEIEHLLGLDVPGRTWVASADLPAA